jgi:hypothetical protein
LAEATPIVYDVPCVIGSGRRRTLAVLEMMLKTIKLSLIQGGPEFERRSDLNRNVFTTTF